MPQRPGWPPAPTPVRPACPSASAPTGPDRPEQLTAAGSGSAAGRARRPNTSVTEVPWAAVKDVVQEPVAVEVGGLDALAFDLAEATTAVRRISRRAIRTGLDQQALAGAQVEVLVTVVESPGIGVAETARALGVAPNTVSTLVGQLVGAGLLERTEDADDRRAALLLPTAAGCTRVRRWRQERSLPRGPRPRPTQPGRPPPDPRRRRAHPAPGRGDDRPARRGAAGVGPADGRGSRPVRSSARAARPRRSRSDRAATCARPRPVRAATRPS